VDVFFNKNSIKKRQKSRNKTREEEKKESNKEANKNKINKEIFRRNKNLETNESLELKLKY
jgi:hypothetical protein